MSCLYGIGNPKEFEKNVIEIKQNQMISRTKLMYQLVQSLYSRTTSDLSRGNFRVLGDIIDVFLVMLILRLKFTFFGDEIELIEAFDPLNNKKIERYEKVNIFPANIL